MNAKQKQFVKPLNLSTDKVIDAVLQPPKDSVFSLKRTLKTETSNVSDLQYNCRQQMNGEILLNKLDDNSIPLVFFDPQYRSVLDKMSYGNEGKTRGKARTNLPQMSVDDIQVFIAIIERVLIPSGHLMLWVDKYIMCGQLGSLLNLANKLQVVDMLTWNKDRMGMGYRSRRYSEHLIILQKPPIKAKGVWSIHDIPDVWKEKITNGEKNHAHSKPVKLQARLIEATTNKGDIVVDPSAGGYSVLKACKMTNRTFLGCDILP